MRWWTDAPGGEVRYTAICRAVPMYKGERRSILHAALFAASTLRLLGRSFDVILADQIPILQLVPLRVVAWIKRVKLVVQWHEVWDREDWRDYLGVVAPLAATLERVTVRLADRVVAVSDEVRRRLESIGVDPARLAVVPNAVDRARLDSVRPVERAVQLITMGRLAAHKHVDDAIRVAGHLRARGRSVSLVVIGAGPERVRLEGLVATLGLEGCVEFAGLLDADEEVWSWLKAAQVFVFPSDREGFGLAVAESLAMGTPVVCVDHPRNDARHLVDEGLTGSVVPPNDLRALANAVDHWLDVHPSHIDVSSRFWEAHGGLDWDVSAAGLAGLLSPLVSDRTPS